MKFTTPTGLTEQKLDVSEGSIFQGAEAAGIGQCCGHFKRNIEHGRVNGQAQGVGRRLGIGSYHRK